MAKQWTVREVAAITKPGTYRVSRNLYLQVERAAAGGVTKSFLFRYMLNGVQRNMGLGSVELVTLVEAREKVLAGRRLLLQGDDPLAHRRAERQQAALATASMITFRGLRRALHRCSRGRLAQRQAPPAVAEHVVDLRQPGNRRSAGRRDRHGADDADRRAAMDGEGRDREPGAREGRVHPGWATARQHRSGDNPARWRGHLDQLLPKKTKVRAVEHHEALPYAEMPAFMQELRSQAGTGARCLEFTILTAARTGEAIGAKWPEIDLKGKTWTVPGLRMKGGKDHTVPLSDRAVEILQAQSRTGDFIFEGARAGRPISNMTMLKTLERMGRADLTVHGFRNAFRDWAAEKTSYPNHVVEMALAHAIGDKVEAAYRRGDLLRKRRNLMRDWAKYCG